MLPTAIRRRLTLTIMGALLMTMSLLLTAPIPAFAQKSSPALGDTSTVARISLRWRGGTYSQHSQVATAWSNAVNLAWSASMRSPDYRYTTWFGRYNPDYYGYVEANITRVYNSMSEERYTIDYTGTGCKSSDEVAYTHIGMMTVYLCALFWKLPMWGLDSKIGTLIHEDTHIMAGLYDITYGTTNCRNLAKSDPFEAVHNADSYEYYVMS